MFNHAPSESALALRDIAKARMYAATVEQARARERELALRDA